MCKGPEAGRHLGLLRIKGAFTSVAGGAVPGAGTGRTRGDWDLASEGHGSHRRAGSGSDFWCQGESRQEGSNPTSANFFGSNDTDNSHRYHAA